MRFTYRMKFGNLTMMFLFAHTQSLKGITSKVGDDQHVILLDLESSGESYNEMREELKQAQKLFDLSNIYIVSDKPADSWHAYCFNVVTLRKYIHIQTALKFCDWQFTRYTMRRNEATLRISKKHNRPRQKIIDVLTSYYLEPPAAFPSKLIFYDTGLEKTGVYVNVEKNKCQIKH